MIKLGCSKKGGLNSEAIHHLDEIGLMLSVRMKSGFIAQF